MYITDSDRKAARNCFREIRIIFADLETVEALCAVITRAYYNFRNENILTCHVNLPGNKD